MSAPETKDSLRDASRRGRAALTAEHWAAEDAARYDLWRSWRSGSPATLACYVARTGEPATRAIIDDALAARWRVLLPVLRRDVAWAWFRGWEAMRPSWGGIWEPTTGCLGPDALAAADVILVPCLGLGRDGSRLGTGGGWYDRALPHRRSGATVLALARAAELHPRVPVEPHDLGVDAWITERGFETAR